MDKLKNTGKKSNRGQVRSDMPTETNKQAARHQKSVAISHAFFIFRQVRP
jgi:hypothetical protein